MSCEFDTRPFTE